MNFLIVEDNPNLRQLLVTVVRHHFAGADVVEVADMASLDAVLKSAAFDVVLTNSHLGAIGGPTIVGRISQHQPGVPVVVVMAPAGEEQAVEVMAAGASDCVMQHRLHRLPDAIRTSIERSRRPLRLERELAQLRAVLDSLPDMVVVVDAQGEIRFASPSVAYLSGYRLPAVVGQNAFSYIHPDDVPRLRQVLEASVRRRGNADFRDFRWRHRDGSWHTVEARGMNLLHDPGVRGLVVSARELAPRSRDSLVSLGPQAGWPTDSNRVGVMLETLDGCVVDANQAFLDMMGYSREHLFGALIRSDRLNPPEYTLQDDLARLAVWHNGYAPGREKELIRRDGTRVPIHIGMSRLVNAPDTMVSFVTDLTEPNRGREAAQRSERQMLQAQKLEAMGSLTLGVAHDLNNLLTSMLGYSEMAQVALAAGRPAHLELEQVQTAARLAGTLTWGLLAFGRPRAPEPRAIELNAVVGSMEKLLRRLMEANIELVTRLDPAVGSVVVDPGQLEVTLLNLAVNARDAMRGGGKLSIETSNVDLSDTQRVGPFVMLAVSDTGCGMDAQTQARIFDQFFTTKRTGTGLGLSTARAIVMQSGGWITVESRLKEGSTFRVFLPRVDFPAGPKLPMRVRSVRRTGTILVADHDAMLISVVAYILRGAGHTVLQASTGQDALQLADAQAGRIDVLIVDVHMFRMHPAEVDRPWKVLYISGYPPGEVDDVPEVVPFLQKPFTPAVLLQEVEALLAPDGESS